MPLGKQSPAGVAASLCLLLLLGQSARAQYDACGDTLALYSPPNLSVQYESSPVAGNRLLWDEVDPSLTSCFRLDVPAALASRIQPQLSGDYTAIYDREIELKFSDSGVVGTTSQDLLRVVVTNTHPNADIPSLSGIFNLSSRGGVFRVNVAGALASATQSNAGIPNHLERTNLTSMVVWSAPDNSSHRIYAAMENIPIVRSDDGGQSWVETAQGGLDPIGFPVTHLAVSPSDQNLLFAGTATAGLWVSRDGGASFALADAAIRPSGTFSGTTVLRFLRRPTGGYRLFVGMSGIGNFTSDDDGATWTRVTTLRVPNNLNPQGSDSCPGDPDQATPRVLSIAQSPNDPNVLYVGLNTWGVYRTGDFGASWSRANTNLVRCDAGVRRGANVTRLAVIDDGGSDRLVVGTTFVGSWFSVDQGASWFPGQGLPVDSATNIPTALQSIVEYPPASLRLVAATPNDGLVESTDGGANWNPLAFGPAALYTARVGSMVLNPVIAGELVVGTLGAGVYRPGESIDLSRTLAKPQGVHAGKDLSIGLSIRFATGQANANESLRIFGQSFQGYAVWRAVSDDPDTGQPNWQLIGLYDRINPESCSPSGCDELSPIQIPGCFANKRSNCFDFNPDGTAQFFDRDVFNGFTYRYAVSSFDYLFGGRVSPANFSGGMLFSPRSPLESTPEALPFVGSNADGSGPNYNVQSFQVNLATRTNLDDVFVVPNPLRRQAGWDFGDQSSIRFFNVTPNSSCEIYTLAGDLVARLGNVVDQGVQKGIIEWNTKNPSGELVASGVYIYRITNADGEELIDRFTIIR